MRNLNLLNSYRRTDAAVIKHFGSIGDGSCGVFSIPSKIDKALLLCVASEGMGWDHVSVTRRNRTANWPEMCQIVDLFWESTDTVMQLHLPALERADDNLHCLHLWRPIDAEIPKPPFSWDADMRTRQRLWLEMGH